MNALPKHFMVGLALFGVIGLLGGGAWFWTSGQLEQAIAERADINQQLSAVQSKGYSPTTQNLKLLENNRQAVTTLADELLPQLNRGAARFDPFLGPEQKGLTPDAWKDKLINIREELKKLADQNGVQTADDFYFSFKRYRVAAPPAAATREIGIQLAAVEELSRLLIAAKVSDLREFRRVMVEDGGSASGPASQGASGSADEVLAAAVVDGAGGLYRVYPFEIKFQSSPGALNAFLGQLGRSPMVFVTRFIAVENEKNSVPKRSEFANTAAAVNPIGERTETKLLVPIMGQEKIITRLRIDLIFWNNTPAKDAAPAGPAAKTAKP